MIKEVLPLPQAPMLSIHPFKDGLGDLCGEVGRQGRADALQGGWNRVGHSGKERFYRRAKAEAPAGIDEVARDDAVPFVVLILGGETHRHRQLLRCDL
jgi:hypothetical protein